MPFYESVLIARQDISAAQVDSLADELTEVVKANGGEVAKREYWGLKNLAYKMKKNRKGHYVLLNLDAPPAAVTEFERIMRYNEDILRYLTVRVAALDPEPSVMMQKGRDDRPQRGRFGGRDGGRGDRDHRGDRGGDRENREGRGDRENRAEREGDRA
jgi:small subunit ribosomal protein S6